MKYAKLIDNRLIIAPNPILHGGVRIGNPPAEVLEAEGYKPVRFTEAPETEPGYIAVPGWVETPAEIVQVWTVELEPVTEDKALVRYSNKLTGAEDKTLTEATETLIKKVMEE